MHVTSLGNLTTTYINWQKKIIATFTLAPTRVHVHFFLSELARLWFAAPSSWRNVIKTIFIHTHKTQKPNKLFPPLIVRILRVSEIYLIHKRFGGGCFWRRRGWGRGVLSRNTFKFMGRVLAWLFACCTAGFSGAAFNATTNCCDNNFSSSPAAAAATATNGDDDLTTGAD